MEQTGNSRKTKTYVLDRQPFIDLNVAQYGCQECDPLHSFGPAMRNHYIFHYVLSGKGTVAARTTEGEDRLYTVQAGQGFLLSPGQVTLYTADERDPWTYAWIEFDGLIVRELMLAAGLSVNRPIFTCRSQSEQQQIARMFQELTQSPPRSSYKLIGQTYMILDAIKESSLSRQLASGKKMTDYYLDSFIRYVEEHYYESISVDSMAEFLHISRTYLNKIVKQATGKSPREFLMTYRLTKAAELLIHTSLSVSQVGEAVGYPNLLVFSRAFKNYYQKSPSIWQREHAVQASRTSKDADESAPAADGSERAG